MYFEVGFEHKVHYELYGNSEGIKVLFLHGGPGLGFSENDKSFFDPDKFHVLFIDQRGCGKSTPGGSLSHNTTQDLIDDIYQIASYLNFGPFVIFGGSWGGTLAILFAAQYPKLVDRMILRGVFSATTTTRDSYLRGEIRNKFPDYWQQLTDSIPNEYFGREAEYVFETIDKEGVEALELAYEWSRYGFSLSRKKLMENEIETLVRKEEVDLDRIRIELHYALNGFFIPEGYVFEAAKMLGNIPVVLIHGEHDHLCPLDDAEKLAKNIPRSVLTIVDAGHSTAEREIRDQILLELDNL